VPRGIQQTCCADIGREIGAGNVRRAIKYLKIFMYMAIFINFLEFFFYIFKPYFSSFELLSWVSYLLLLMMVWDTIL
jgi:hypothetical protein